MLLKLGNARRLGRTEAPLGKLRICLLALCLVRACTLQIFSCQAVQHDLRPVRMRMLHEQRSEDNRVFLQAHA